MQLRLRTKLTLVMSGLVLLVVAAVSGVYFAQLLQQVLDQSEKRSIEIAENTFDQVNGALRDAKSQGWLPGIQSLRKIFATTSRTLWAQARGCRPSCRRRGGLLHL